MSKKNDKLDGEDLGHKIIDAMQEEGEKGIMSLEEIIAVSTAAVSSVAFTVGGEKRAKELAKIMHETMIGLAKTVEKHQLKERFKDE